MGDQKNMQLEDDILFQAQGGVKTDEDCLPEFDATGTVAKQMGSGESLIYLSDGAQVIASTEDGRLVEEGRRVGLFAQGGGWLMRELPA